VEDRWIPQTAVAMLALLVLAGCGDERASHGDACQVRGEYGELGGVRGIVNSSGGELVWAAMVDDDSGVDVVRLSIQLVGGRGVFAGGLAPGRYSIAGAELDPRTCGACIRLRVVGVECYFARAGTLDLGSTEVELTGQLTGAAFAPVDCATDQPIAGDCDSRIDSVSFSETIGGGG
jgi:hypothetical protein